MIYELKGLLTRFPGCIQTQHQYAHLLVAENLRQKLPHRESCVYLRSDQWCFGWAERICAGEFKSIATAPTQQKGVTLVPIALQQLLYPSPLILLAAVCIPLE